MIQEAAFHCDHCSGVFDINLIEIHPINDMIVCEGCYAQLKGGLKS